VTTPTVRRAEDQADLALASPSPQVSQPAHAYQRSIVEQREVPMLLTAENRIHDTPQPRRRDMPPVECPLLGFGLVPRAEHGQDGWIVPPFAD
jgi:hypothetical protein